MSSHTDRTVFVPDSGNRKDTAVLLVGTAREFDIDQRSIRMVPGGFWITEELAERVYSDDVPSGAAEETVEEPAASAKETKTSKRATQKKTSGNRAAKKPSSTEKE